MSTAVGVLILDEPQDLSATVRATLEHMPELHTIGEADLDRADTDNTVALIFLDEIRLADGIARIVGLKERQPTIRTLVVFGALTADDLRALLAAGADAFVARSRSSRELGAALLALAEGSDCLAPSTQPAPLPAEAADGLGLTPREAEVLRFLSSGFSNKEVARRLALSVRTVETHRLNLRRKTQTGRLKDLVSLARQLGLAPVVDNGDQIRRGTDSRTSTSGRDNQSRH
ncbi:LuxR C-terminal-related transcriptional regulator [Methylobacterium sp. J-070]|uniref:LuxR C-terminal-related transcriptional regulator n=1 Tax=Methylobacterium sp. J-070 TaxID=2836650 RepID=UPI001FBAB056|nr:response regulator transcription factor [Methylobacterium sp. J-070]MCJ2053778.1 response regulator transcription factor [Methylobacterium sp. J-070]